MSTGVWMQLVSAEPCGRCGVLQSVGTVVRAYEPNFRSSARRIRCQLCTGQAAPRQLSIRLTEPVVTRNDMETRMTHIGQIAVQVRRPERPKPQLVKAKRAYRGEPEQQRQPEMLENLPWYDR